MVTKFEKIAAKAYIEMLPKSTKDGLISFFASVKRDGAERAFVDMPFYEIQNMLGAAPSATPPTKKKPIVRSSPDDMAMRRAKTLALLHKGPASSMDIRNELGLSAQQIQKVLATLRDKGLVEMCGGQSVRDTTYCLASPTGPSDSELASVEEMGRQDTTAVA